LDAHELVATSSCEKNRATPLMSRPSKAYSAHTTQIKLAEAAKARAKMGLSQQAFAL
jgi:DNA-binding transcriptional regulator YiaG